MRDDPPMERVWQAFASGWPSREVGAQPRSCQRRRATDGPFACQTDEASLQPVHAPLEGRQVLEHARPPLRVIVRLKEVRMKEPDCEVFLLGKVAPMPLKAGATDRHPGRRECHEQLLLEAQWVQQFVIDRRPGK